MADQGPVLVLTRPEPQSRAFLAECRSRLDRDIDAVISPIMRIDPKPYDLDLERFKTLIVTSRNALEQIRSPLEGRTVLTVGKRTAEHASALGAVATCLGETVDAFVSTASDIIGPAVYLRGVHSRGDLAARLRAKGFSVEECEVYDQVAQPLTKAAVTALAGGRALVPVFSPRSAALVSRSPVHPDTVVLAISRAAADAWSAEGRVRVSERPDKNAMLDLVATSF